MYPILCMLALGFGLAIVLTPLVINFCEFRGWGLSAPALHHTHKQPVPRLGGLILAVVFISLEIAISVIAPEVRTKSPAQLPAILCCLAMFALGFIDDLKPLGAKKKLFGQIAIALAAWAMGIEIATFKVPFSGILLDLRAWSAVLTVFWLVSMTNLINLIDGLDGLAAGISLMLMALMAVVGHPVGSFGLLATGMVGGLLGFLRHNLPPARIYLGDGGAYFLGCQIGVFSLVNSHKGTVFAVLVAPLFVLALPILDTALAIIRRGLHGLPIFRPDRHHIHHRLLRTGLSRRQVVLFGYSLTLVFLLLGLVTIWLRGEHLPILLGIAALVLLFCAGRFSFSREWFSVGRVVGNSLEMRQEVQYALSLTRWLAMEGRRGGTVSDLWNDLLFAARKLGFAQVRLKLEDEQRVWRADGDPETLWKTSFELQAGRLGTLELSAGPQADCAQPQITSERLFEILSDLLAEAWGKAADAWLKETGSPGALSFGTTTASLETAGKLSERNPGVLLVGGDCTATGL